jgi:hypothetical protein
MKHPSSLAFHRILHEMGELHDRKQADYGRAHDPFANVRASVDFGVPGWVGCMVRANDKMRRIQAFAVKGELRNESVLDSLMDLAVYAVIATVLYREEHGDGDETDAGQGALRADGADAGAAAGQAAGGEGDWYARWRSCAPYSAVVNGYGDDGSGARAADGQAERAADRAAGLSGDALRDRSQNDAQAALARDLGFWA